jgi:predicted transcriptional regulator
MNMNNLGPKDLRSFLIACESFNGNEPMFPELLKWALQNLSISNQDLANQCQVSPNSIERWATGEVSPHPLTKQFVISKLKYFVEKQSSANHSS